MKFDAEALREKIRAKSQAQAEKERANKAAAQQIVDAYHRCIRPADQAVHVEMAVGKVLKALQFVSPQMLIQAMATYAEMVRNWKVDRRKVATTFFSDRFYEQFLPGKSYVFRVTPVAHNEISVTIEGEMTAEDAKALAAISGIARDYCDQLNK